MNNDYAIKLSEILERYDQERSNFRHFIKSGDNNRETLLEFQGRFVDLKSEIRPIHSHLMGYADQRSDKAATAIKYRIAMAMMRGEYELPEGEKPLYDKTPTINSAEKYAAASKQYKTFLEQRAFAKESLTNVNDLREDLNSFINEIKDRLK